MASWRSRSRAGSGYGQSGFRWAKVLGNSMVSAGLPLLPREVSTCGGTQSDSRQCDGGRGRRVATRRSIALDGYVCVRIRACRPRAPRSDQAGSRRARREHGRTTDRTEEAVAALRVLFDTRLSCTDDAAFVVPNHPGDPGAILVYTRSGMTDRFEAPPVILEDPVTGADGRMDLLSDDGQGKIVLIARDPFGRFPGALMDPKSGCHALLRNPRVQSYRQFAGIHADLAHWCFTGSMKKRCAMARGSCTSVTGRTGSRSIHWCALAVVRHVRVSRPRFGSHATWCGGRSRSSSRRSWRRRLRSSWAAGRSRSAGRRPEAGGAAVPAWPGRGGLRVGPAGSAGRRSAAVEVHGAPPAGAVDRGAHRVGAALARSRAGSWSTPGRTGST